MRSPAGKASSGQKGEKENQVQQQSLNEITDSLDTNTGNTIHTEAGDSHSTLSSNGEKVAV